MSQIKRNYEKYDDFFENFISIMSQLNGPFLTLFRFKVPKAGVKSITVIVWFEQNCLIA